MSDAADALNRIAEILAEESFLQTTAGQFLILVAGALVGAYMTYRFGKKHQQEVDANRKAEELTERTADRHLLTVGTFAQTDKNSHRISSIFVTCTWKNAHGRYGIIPRRNASS
jgi:hypothetical protein